MRPELGILLRNETMKTLRSKAWFLPISSIAHLRRRRQMWWKLPTVRRPTFIADNEYCDEYQKVLIFIAQVHRSTDQAHQALFFMLEKM